jgi:hypothetical protein
MPLHARTSKESDALLREVNKASEGRALISSFPALAAGQRDDRVIYSLTLDLNTTEQNGRNVSPLSRGQLKTNGIILVPIPFAARRVKRVSSCVQRSLRTYGQADIWARIPHGQSRPKGRRVI